MLRHYEEERRLCMTFSLNAVHARRSIYDSEQRIFASDLRSHGQCMNKYFLRYKRDIEMESEDDIDHCDKIIMGRFQFLVETLELDKGHPLSTCAKFLEKLTFLTPF